MSNKIQEILNFWFKDVIEDGDSFTSKNNPKWFDKDPNFDLEIKKKFENDLQNFQKGIYNDWLNTPEGSLAAVILLDQFPRNIYRGDAKAFSFDHFALKIARESLDKQFDKKLPPIKRIWFYLPFEHSENLEDQKLCVKLYEQVANERKEEFFKICLKYAIRHYEIIERFGRFPHRNKILKRQSTKEEEEFLKEPFSSF